MHMDIRFPGGKQVDAHFEGFTVRTDQKPKAGGAGSAPEPFSLFLASFGACAGIYVLGFCQARGIPTEGVTVSEDAEFDPESHRLLRIKLDIQVPPSFPAKYLPALQHAADHCAVKRAILNPPEFVIGASVKAEPVRAQVTV